MALRAVAARMDGDLYQGMFFWYQAAQLLAEDTHVARVVLEHDEAGAVDDIAVYYHEPGVRDGLNFCTADFYQVKYHVDRRDDYSSVAMIDPSFLGQTKSILTRFYNAYTALAPAHGHFRLHLVSNWRWRPDDVFAATVRESDGSLPADFFTAGKRSKLGKIREAWRAHVGGDEEEFADFARRLRFGLDHLGRQHFRGALSDRLALHGLKPIPADRLGNPYDGLAQQFIVRGVNDFDQKGLRALCEAEGLINEAVPRGPQAPVVGIRSFMRFAESIEAETDRFVCVAGEFDGRHLREGASWDFHLVQAVYDFLQDPRLRTTEHHLLLECHGSLAFFAGYELDRKSGATVYPVQKGEKTTVWKPQGASAGSKPGWQIDIVDGTAGCDDVAIAISITHDIRADVERYLRSAERPVRMLAAFTLASGPGYSSIKDADHAVFLAELLATHVRSLQIPGGRVHLFAAAPNSFLYYLGRYRSALGPLQLYEFDFEGERGGLYEPSLSLPLSHPEVA